MIEFEIEQLSRISAIDEFSASTQPGTWSIVVNQNLPRALHDGVRMMHDDIERIGIGFEFWDWQSQEDESPPNKRGSILSDRHWGEPSQSTKGPICSSLHGVSRPGRSIVREFSLDWDWPSKKGELKFCLPLTFRTGTGWKLNLPLTIMLLICVASCYSFFCRSPTIKSCKHVSAAVSWTGKQKNWRNYLMPPLRLFKQSILSHLWS